MWNKCSGGFLGLGIFISNCQKLAPNVLSGRSSVVSSHEMHVSIFCMNFCWFIWRLATLALAWVLVRSCWSLTNLSIFIPRGKVVALEEDSFISQGSLFQLANLICRALGLILLAPSFLGAPSSTSQKHSPSCTPINAQISLWSATLLYSAVE